MRIIKAGLLYFVIVFGTGFILGPLRIFFLVPRVGERTAELIEAPIMLIVIVLSARWLTQRLQLDQAAPPRLGMGLIGLALMVMAEFSLVLWLRGLTMGEYFATRDPVSGSAYYLLLLVFALMPLILAKK